MATCDVCEREITGKPATSRRGRWGLVLCHTCWARLRGQERKRATLEAQAEAIWKDGPPYAWPLCELCGGDLDAQGLGYYTTKGTPRRFCSTWCKATRNSRVGAPIRAAQMQERVKRGLWQNPAEYHTSETLKAAALTGAEVRAEQHRAALEAGTWANPADAPGAREKLSRPRVHGDDPDLHAAIEKLRRGFGVADLNQAEAEAHRAYRRRQGRAMRRRPSNLVLRAARERAGLSKAALARAVGVALNTAWGWEAYGARPRDSETRRRVAEVLGCWPWSGDGPGWNYAEHDRADVVFMRLEGK